MHSCWHFFHGVVELEERKEKARTGDDNTDLPRRQESLSEIKVRRNNDMVTLTLTVLGWS